jgi:predicted house-cleaning noncanonical NTP pyrophosphatase (MazG superfamily)
MKKIHYNKLIRDKIPEKIEKDGADYEVKKLGQKEFEMELIKKLIEESSGIVNTNTKEDMERELADLLDVVDEVVSVKKLSKARIKKEQIKNLSVKGGFRKKLFLFWTTDSGYKTNELRFKKK